MKTVFVGGFVESRKSLQYVASIMEPYFGDTVEVITFADAMRNPELVVDAAKDSRLVVHSSGALLLAHDMSPHSVVVLNPSQPVPRGSLFLRAARRTFIYTWGLIKMPLDLLPVTAVLASNGLELFRHPIGNLRPLLQQRISRFDIADIVENYDDLTVVVALEDEMFQLTEYSIINLQSPGLTVLTLPISHDEIFIRPKKLLEQIFERAK